MLLYEGDQARCESQFVSAFRLVAVCGQIEGCGFHFDPSLGVVRQSCLDSCFCSPSRAVCQIDPSRFAPPLASRFRLPAPPSFKLRELLRS